MKLEELVPAHENAVLLISDQGYLPATQFVTAQIPAQGAANCDVVVMAFDCRGESRGHFPPGVSVVDIEPDPRLRTLHHLPRQSVGIYVRLCAIDGLRGKYRKGLYLDGDVWIGSRPLVRLFDIDLGHYALAAVRDAAEILRPLSAEWAEYRTQSRFPEGAAYFNSGMLLLDFMAATRFADVEAGIVLPSWQAPAPDPG